MKLLTNLKFESLNTALSHQTENMSIKGSLESFSCKMTGNDKKLYKNLNTRRSEELSQSPVADMEALSPTYESMEYGVSPGSYLSKSCGSEDELANDLPSLVSRKTLFYLLSTLNATFPDYDFSSAQSEEFSQVPSLEWVITTVNSNLSTAMGAYYTNISSDMWKALDEEISLKDCDIFSYHPDMESDPFAEDGSLWSFNYFFFNKTMKRMVFFKLKGTSLSSIDYEMDQTPFMFEDHKEELLQ